MRNSAFFWEKAVVQHINANANMTETRFNILIQTAKIQNYCSQTM
jgi:hypothetical protein